ncbi:MAG TPA: DUF4177 domain-containing protein [Pyrinomonadaceae bacterium]|jgi:hypothetical protein|nr:DUF4177 domain-containing protein [Pyrinomonadaceae bacterium]
MKLNRLALAAILCLLLLTVAGWTMSRPATQQWEYKVSQVINAGLKAMPAMKIENQINELARDGWELVAVERDAPGVTLTLYFKRQKQ